MAAANAIEYHREEARKRQIDGAKTRENNYLTDILNPNSTDLSIPGMLPSDELTVAAPIECARDESPIENGKASAALAKTVGVSQATIERAVFVKKQGTADDVKAVATGQKSVKAVAQGAIKNRH